ncbi:MAG: ribonuclease HII [Gammaproteobacteria bacterium]
MDRKYRLVAGIDEVGRGCIAGPVVAAVVVLDDKNLIDGLADSKKLTPKRRSELAKMIREKALDFSIGRAEVSEIDAVNILNASLLAMKRAFSGLQYKPDWVLVDGNHYPRILCAGETRVQGDLTEPAISAASILAKVERDEEMTFLDRIYDGYEFAKHKGYPTKTHLSHLSRLGISEIHRITFAPVRGRIAEPLNLNQPT